jgi:hypothetical protein
VRHYQQFTPTELPAMAANAQQRAMMENMIGPQLEMMRSMVNGGGIDITNIICNVLVDQGLPDPLIVGSPSNACR